MAQLAIKGHPTRGEEVVRILSMLGGIQCGYGSNCKGFYFIDDCGNIVAYDNIPKHRKNDFIIFSLEEFLKKYPYKVGDKVKTKHPDTKGTLIDEIVDMIWDVDKVLYELSSSDLLYFYAEELQPYKEETMEGKVESFEILESHCADEVKIEFDPFKFEIVERDNCYYVVKKKPKFPKTYNECWKILDAGEEEVVFDGATASEEVLLDSFIKLKRCRDAYWKIAGDWKPNLDSKQHKFAITNVGNKISFEVYGEYNSILCLPTAEMRDAFYENFKSLIEECKELL